MGYAPTVFEIHILVLLSVTVILTLSTKLIIQYLTHNICIKCITFRCESCPLRTKEIHSLDENPHLLHQVDIDNVLF